MFDLVLGKYSFKRLYLWDGNPAYIFSLVKSAILFSELSLLFKH